LAISHTSIFAVFQKHPSIAALFWRETLIDAAIFRELMVGIGRRSAYSRMAHLFCELIERMRAVGLASDHEIELPLTQTEIADALGLSTVHANRTLQQLRAAGLIKLTRHRLTAMNWRGLCTAGDFEPAYLHQRQRKLLSPMNSSEHRQRINY
jgi:CRP-like cAMP-binding protein